MNPESGDLYELRLLEEIREDVKILKRVLRQLVRQTSGIRTSRGIGEVETFSISGVQQELFDPERESQP